ncbi:hypothetical protein [Streptococcus ruminantium]
MSIITLFLITRKKNTDILKVLLDNAKNKR